MVFPKRKSSKKKVVRRSETFVKQVEIEEIPKLILERKKTPEEIDLEKKIFSIKQRVELGNLRQSVVQTDLRKMNKQLIRMRG